MRLPKESPWSSQRAKGYQIKQVIETNLPHLTQPQLTGLAWWVCGTILAGSACQMPSRPPSPPGQLEQPAPVSQSISGSGCTTAATGRVPARPNWT